MVFIIAMFISTFSTMCFNFSWRHLADRCTLQALRGLGVWTRGHHRFAARICSCGVSTVFSIT